MRSKQHLQLSLCLIAGLLLNTLGPTSVIAKDKKVSQAAKGSPNIVFILTDDQRLEDIQHMPKLKRLLIGQGMMFDNYFSNVSLCCPSRTSILRGQYAHNTGVLTNGEPNGGFSTAHRLGLEDSTVATWLHGAGYRTALIGKYLNHYPGQLGPAYIPPGWDYWASAVEGNAYGEYNYTLNENGKSVHYGRNPEDYGTDVYAGKAIDFIKTATKDKTPFFVYLALYAPHGPATPAPRHLGQFADAKIVRTPAFNEPDVSTKPQFIQHLEVLTPQEVEAADAYYQKRLCSLQAVDETIEKLYQTLSENNQLDNTYIVFASDNGFHLGEHRMRRGKQTAYETDIHLPLIVRGPGIKSGAQSEQIVGNVDLAPTFADLAGASPPAFVDGRSLVPLFKGASAKEMKWRNVFLVEHATQSKGGKRRRLTESPVKSSEFQLASYGAEEVAELAEADTDAAGKNSARTEPAGGASAGADSKTDDTQSDTSEDSLQMKDEGTTPKDGAKKRKGGRRKRRGGGAGGGGGELGRIPDLQALREAESLYVEYSTGEREYYRLKDDSAEVNNLIGKPEAKDSDAKAGRLNLIKSSAAQKARELESASP